MIRAAARTKDDGSHIIRLAPALRQLLPDETIISGVKYTKGISDIEALKEIMRTANGPWIAQIVNFKTVGPNHSVIVDKIVGKIVHIRDPWALERPGWGLDFGVKATVRIEDFAEYWAWGGNNYCHILK